MLFAVSIERNRAGRAWVGQILWRSGTAETGFTTDRRDAAGVWDGIQAFRIFHKSGPKRPVAMSSAVQPPAAWRRKIAYSGGGTFSRIASIGLASRPFSRARPGLGLLLCVGGQHGFSQDVAQALGDPRLRAQTTQIARQGLWLLTVILSSPSQKHD
jgi:hypothetical protein